MILNQKSAAETTITGSMSGGVVITVCKASAHPKIKKYLVINATNIKMATTSANVRTLQSENEGTCNGNPMKLLKILYKIMEKPVPVTLEEVVVESMP